MFEEFSSELVLKLLTVYVSIDLPYDSSISKLKRMKNKPHSDPVCVIVAITACILGS